MSFNLKVQRYSKLCSIEEMQWNLLFPDFPDSFAMLQFIEETGFEGFSMGSIVVKLGDRPILFLPLYRSKYEVADSLEGGAQKFVRLLSGFLPFIFKPEFLGIGFVASDWNAIGYDRKAEISLISAAWDLALAELEKFIASEKVSLSAFIVLDRLGGEIVLLEKLKDYTPMPGEPWSELAISFKTLDEYFEMLSKATKKDIKRKIKKASEVKIVRGRDPSKYLDVMYELYLKTVRRSERVCGSHPSEFLSGVCQNVTGCEYVWYFYRERCVGFNLLARVQDVLVDKLFCMDPEVGRDCNLYFVSWVENIRFCLANNIAIYNAGASKEDLKARLGAKLNPTTTLFKHRNRVVNKIFSFAQRFTVYSPSICNSLPELGTAWQTKQSRSILVANA